MRATFCGKTGLICHIRRFMPFLIGQPFNDVQQQQLRGVCCTPVVRFDIKQHEMEKRRRRELERAGLNADDDDDDALWVAPEEQRLRDAAEERRRAEEAERVRVMLQRRAEEDVERRKKFREFRARQLAMSRGLKEKRAAAKRREKKDQRVVEEVVGDGESDDNVASKISPDDEAKHTR